MGTSLESGSPSQNYRQRARGATMQRINLGLRLVDPASQGHWCGVRESAGGCPVTSEKGRLQGPWSRRAASGAESPRRPGSLATPEASPPPWRTRGPGSPQHPEDEAASWRLAGGNQGAA